ncbi:LPXTG cell wall anchor domain-containing protein [Streptomyces sp. NPDC006997]|uniref:LPXTG cell wall anchor domain-containing protein n=1 Tax=Streptomyces sp. NPDC006997 TaxID=3155356 RepID=UPI0033EA4E87
MRTLSRAGVFLTAASSAVLLAAPVALATAPGDNGTVKIHDAVTGEEQRQNEPHVCTFYLDAFGFDGVQEVDWHIEAWAPSAGVKGETVESGAITLDEAGHGRTEDLSLADGHYKLFWNFEGEHGSAKHKVFWTDCEDDEEGGGSSSPTPSASASESGGTTASPSPSSSPSASESGGEEVAPGASPSSAPSAQGEDGNLAETGSGAPVGLLSGVAAVLVAAGGFLAFRRRKAQQG